VIEVDHVTVYRWVQTFTAEFIDAARPAQHAAGDRWFVDEPYVKVAGRWIYLYRAIDKYGEVIDVLASTRRDAPAARAFFTRMLRLGLVPVEVVTDRAAMPSCRICAAATTRSSPTYRCTIESASRSTSSRWSPDQVATSRVLATVCLHQRNGAPIDRDVIDSDAVLSQQLLHIAVGQAVAQVPANANSDYLTREPIASRRRQRPGPRVDHAYSLANVYRARSTQQPRLLSPFFVVQSLARAG
jgi:hypothetical protein